MEQSTQQCRSKQIAGSMISAFFSLPHNILNRAALPLQTGATEFGRRQCDTGEDDIAFTQLGKAL